MRDNDLNHFTNASIADSDTSSVSSSDQEASTTESEPSSSSKLCTVVQAPLETSLIIVGLLLIALQLPHPLGTDGKHRYQDLVSLFSTHSLFQPHSRFSLIGPLFSTPLFLIGKQ